MDYHGIKQNTFEAPDHGDQSPLSRLIESEEKVQKLLEENTGLVERFEKSQTALQEMAREQQHLLQVQENIQNRR